MGRGWWIAGRGTGPRTLASSLPWQDQWLGRPHVCCHPREPCCDDCSHVGASSCPRGRSPPPPPSTAVEAGHILDKARGAKLPHRQRQSPLAAPDAAPREVGGVAALQPRCRGSATLLLWQPFPRTGGGSPRSSAHWRPPLPPPFAPPPWAGEGLAEAGSEAATLGQGAEPPAGRGSALGPSFARAPNPIGPPPRYSRAQASSLSSSSWLRASGAGPADRASQTPGRRRPQGADCGSEGGSERWAGAAGARTGAYTARTESGRARARQPAECPHPQSLKLPRRLSRARKAEDLNPPAASETQQEGRQAHPAQGMLTPQDTTGNRLSGPGTCWQTPCRPSSAEHTVC